ncbi:competence/damage-inducible protein A [Kamptonema cortianum]|nr:competence/damage-inducible protein A [Kamptonema cortianum]
MNAEIVSIGTEILLGQIVDTNAALLGSELASLGISHTHRQTVGDNLPRMVEALKLALSRSEIVFTIGGLGPTADDLTRDAIAQATGQELIYDESLAEDLRSNYAHRGVAMVDSQFRQAFRPAHGIPIPNLNGTAPGLCVEEAGRTIFALPGPRNEFAPMVVGFVRDRLSEMTGGGTIHSTVLRVVGIGEAALAEKVSDFMEGEDVTVAPYAKLGEVHLRVTAREESSAVAVKKVDSVVLALRERLGGLVYGQDDESLEHVLIRRLRGHGWTLAVAESCTGGLLAGRLTSVDGSSSAFKGGMVTYSAETKMRFLGVQGLTLATHGTVSEECAKEMAVGVRGRMDSTYGISITGVAGSDSLAEPPSTKPSGRIFIGVSQPAGVTAHKFDFRGDRETIRGRAVSQALYLLHRVLSEK